MTDEQWFAAQERLRAEADRGWPDPWQPENEGDELLGTVRAVRAAVPTAYGPSPVVEVEQPDGFVVSVWLYSTVLRRQFERADVRIGERILVRYRGKVHPEGGGNPYHDFRLVVDRPTVDADVDWRGIAGQYGDDVDELTRGHTAPSAPPPDATAAETVGPPPHSDDDIPF